MGSILISMMFNENKGSYALQGRNIVHETINLLTADDGKNYFYVVPRGKIKDKKHQKQDYLLLVEAYSKNVVKIIALVHNPQYRYDDYANRTAVRYGGKSLLEIFDCNTENDNQYITFVSEKVLVPKGQILIASYDEKKDASITIESSFGQLPAVNKKIRNQSMRLYLSDKAEDADKNYYIILNLINNKDLWIDAKMPKVCDIKRPDLNFTYMNVIGMEDNELAFSNLLFYFFANYPRFFGDFIQRFSDIYDFDLSKLKIEREKNRIDLYATDETWHIIIENKIKSGINGITGEKNGLITSQLKRYFDFLTESDENKSAIANPEKVRCFIFHPNYSNIALSRFEYGEKYKSVTYRELYCFFEKYVDSDELKKEDKLFYQLFLEAMVKHTKDNDTDITDRMIARFIDRINELNAGKD